MGKIIAANMAYMCLLYAIEQGVESGTSNVLRLFLDEKRILIGSIFPGFACFCALRTKNVLTGWSKKDEKLLFTQ